MDTFDLNLSFSPLGGVPTLLARVVPKGRPFVEYRFVEYLRTLSSTLSGLDIRQARILAWFRAQNLAPMSYPGWLPFVTENVDWGESWTRSLIALVRSGLMDVIRAACEGRLALSVAVRAPTTCHPDRQSGWLAAAAGGYLFKAPRPPSGASFTIALGEVDALIVHNARNRMRLLEGLPLEDEEADKRLLAWWRENRAAADILAAALAPAPKPRAAPGDAPGADQWEFPDRAEALLGPWKTPTSLADGMRQLAAVKLARNTRTLRLGRIAEVMIRKKIHSELEFSSIEQFAQQALGMSARSLLRYRDLGRTIRAHPALEAAARSGMALVRIVALGRVVTKRDVHRWIAVARRTPMVELLQATAHAEWGRADELLCAYEALMASTAHTVALKAIQAPVPKMPTDRVHPDLPEAARWLLKIELPAQRGFGKVKERDSFICANPECRRRALRNHAHHVHFKEFGGTDDLSNGITVCPSCHLRLLHTGIVTVRLVGGRQIWDYGDRTIVVA